jgi:hypothetical protein
VLFITEHSIMSLFRIVRIQAFINFLPPLWLNNFIISLKKIVVVRLSTILIVVLQVFIRELIIVFDKVRLKDKHFLSQTIIEDICYEVFYTLTSQYFMFWERTVFESIDYGFVRMVILVISFWDMLSRFAL